MKTANRALAVAAVAVLMGAPGVSVAQTTYNSISATIRCTEPLTAGSAPPLAGVRVALAGQSGVSAVTDALGQVLILQSGTSPQVTVEVTYAGAVSQGLPGGATPLQVMDDMHNARSDEAVATGSVSGDVLALGVVTLNTLDCELWGHGVSVLTAYHARLKKAPPAGRLRIHRWENVVVGTPMTYYDYVTIPADFRTSTEYPGRASRICTMAHEFGHSIRHVLDGSKAHWDGDVVKYAYGRSHNDRLAIFNVQYTFNEGWA